MSAARALVALACLFVSLGAHSPSSVNASDFWDEVRTPGLRAYRVGLEEARAALGARRLTQATTLASAAIALLPDHAAAYVVRGQAHAQAGNHDSATADFQQALELDESCLDEPTVGPSAAQSMTRQGELQAAVTTLTRVLGRMRPSSMRHTVYAMQGDAMMALGGEHLQGAIRAYREATRGSTIPRAQLGLALALRRFADARAADDEAGQTARAESDALAQTLGARSRLPALINSLPLPAAELEARRALTLEATGDHSGALAAWDLARDGAWTEHASAQSTALRDR